MKTSASPRRSWRQWLTLGAVLLVLGLALALHAIAHHERTVAAEQRRLEMQLHTLAADLRAQIDRVRKVLEMLERQRREWWHSPGAIPSTHYLETLHLGMTAVHSLNVTDAKGVILVSSQPELVGQVIDLPNDLHSADPAPAQHLHIVPPPPAVKDATALSVLRVLRDDSGRLLGTVFANMDRAQLQNRITSVLYSDDIWTTITFEDGVPAIEAPGTAMDDGPQAIARGEVDPEDTELASDLLVQLGRDMDAVSAQWWNELWQRLGLYVAFVLVATGGLWLHQKRQREAESHIAAALAALHNSEQGFRLIVEHTVDAVLRIDVEGRYTYANPAYCRLIGLPASRLMGRPIWNDIAATDQHDARQRFQSLLHPPHFLSFVQKHDSPTGIHHIEWVTQAVRNARGRILGIIAVGSDVTKQMRAAEALRAESEKDFLTGLGNRRHFDRRAAREFQRARVGGDTLSLIIVDLDRFKSINDTHGHAAGDAVLQQIAQRLRDGLRDGDAIARIGGEEFAILLPGATPIETIDAGERLRHLVSGTPVHLAADVTLRVTASLGIASLEDGIPTPEALFQLADQALYRAKASGRNRVVMAETA